MANKAPAFQFYAKDWLDMRVMRMSYEAQGVYARLLAHMWADSPNQCSIENNPKMLSRLLGLSAKKFQKIIAEIQWPNDPIFLEEDGFFISKRLRKEKEKQVKISTKRAEAAENRWGKTDANASANAKQAQCKQDALQSSSSSSDEEKNNRVSPLPPRGGQGPVVLPPSPEDDPDAQPGAEISSLNDCVVEFQDLAAAYQQAGGFVDVAPAYKLYEAMRHNFPLARIVADLEQRKLCDQWQRGKIPKLSNYLRDRVWLNAIQTRASPSRDPTTPRNYRECQDAERRQEAERLRAGRMQHGQTGMGTDPHSTGRMQHAALPASAAPTGRT